MVLFVLHCEVVDWVGWLRHKLHALFGDMLLAAATATAAIAAAAVAVWHPALCWCRHLPV
jgi:hypothetical protein